ncbi:MAG: hypothetical protein CVU56_17200 [Deltaproteobacteria bacterium HGW-Deltaproteobacteria-14]|jgi:methylmalonic aciduria homocystinuria type C protein|nr:MAG: hypothetical protein CVU56_17200 [Deltaproteobacteria bacterium HGW-Deltaproteobacteria-14]
METWGPLFEAVARQAAAAGLDLAAAGRAGDYNRTVEAPWRLPDFGRRDALVIVLGHTRALWPRFIAALDADRDLRIASDPLDLWTERTVARIATANIASQYALRFPHEAPPRRVAFQRLADAVGLAQLGPAMLCVDPVHGPWLGLRAAVVVDLPGPAAAPRGPRPCDGCVERPCVPALGLAAARAAVAPDDLRPWLAVRDACPVGREHRYGPRQVGYHYTRDRAMLRLEDGVADPASEDAAAPSAPPPRRDESNP